MFPSILTAVKISTQSLQRSKEIPPIKEAAPAQTHVLGSGFKTSARDGWEFEPEYKIIRFPNPDDFILPCRGCSSFSTSLDSLSISGAISREEQAHEVHYKNFWNFHSRHQPWKYSRTFVNSNHAMRDSIFYMGVQRRPFSANLDEKDEAEWLQFEQLQLDLDRLRKQQPSAVAEKASET